MPMYVDIGSIDSGPQTDRELIGQRSPRPTLQRGARQSRVRTGDVTGFADPARP